MSISEGSGKGVSRRSFLTGAALGTMGIAASTVLGGCSDSSKNAYSTESVKLPDDTQIDYEVYDADVLIVGAGNGALAAAWQALKEGRNVTLIDKSVFKKSGCSGWSWGCYSSNESPTELLDLTDYLVDMPLWRNVMEFWNETYNPEEVNRSVYEINHGQTLVERTETGAIKSMEVEDWYGCQYYRREMDQLETMSAATVYDNTMVTDLLVNDGKCLGVVGVHIPTGTFRVFRAKSVVNASGTAQWLHGWYNTKPISLGGSDHTGDLMAIGWRQGLAMGDFEWSMWDYQYAPLRLTFGFPIGVDIIQASGLVDVNGDPMMSEEEIYKLAGASDLAIAIAKTAAEGRGNKWNCININLDKEKIMSKPEFWSAAQWYSKYFGIDPFEQTVELLPEMFEKMGGAVVDDNDMTELEGYFDSRGAATIGTRPDNPPISYTIMQYGFFAGHAAAQYASKAEYPSDINFEPAVKEFARLTEIRTRDISDGIRPGVIRENLQKRFFEHMSLLRTTEGLEEFIKEIERIRKEDLPKQCISEHTENWNKEWKEAIENYNMLDVAEISARSTLFREETRYEYYRPEFPDADNANWKCTVVCRNNNGATELSKKEIRSI